MSFVSDAMNAASTAIMNALTFQGFFVQDYENDSEGYRVKVGKPYAMFYGIRVEVSYTKPEITLSVNDKTRSVFIIRVSDYYDESDIRGIASKIYVSANRFARDIKNS